MSLFKVHNLGGLNCYVNPLIREDGEPIKSVNVDSYYYGAKVKRPGYIKYLGTADGSTPTSFFYWLKKDGTKYTYRSSGSSLYYSLNGTGAWTLAGNGTISAGSKVGYAILDDTLIVGDGVGSTRHTTNGTTFTNTTLAPVSNNFCVFDNRVYAGGTGNYMFYSTTGTASDWSTDSSSLRIQGDGTINMTITANDRVVTSKHLGAMTRWDGYSQVTMPTELGPSSTYSIASREGFYFWLNPLGIMGYGGNRPQLLSNAVQLQIYNNSGSAIAGTALSRAPGIVNRYDYYLSVGTITDDYVGYTVPNCTFKYDYQKNEFLNYSYYNNPTAWLSYIDTTGDTRLIFGANGGQCYEVKGTATSDDGQPIEVGLEFVFTANKPDLEKKFVWFKSFFNPGNEGQIQIAVSDAFDTKTLNWIDLGDTYTGTVKYRFPQDNCRGRFLFIRIKESSTTSQFKFYGYSVEAEVIPE